MTITPRMVLRQVGWLVMEITIGAAIGFAIVFFLKYVTGPAQGTIIYKARVEATPTPKPPNAFSGQYAAFQYPGVFDTVAIVKTGVAEVEEYNIGSTSNYRRTLAEAVRPLPSGNPEDDASYKLRTTKQEQYTMSTIKIQGDTVYLATRYDNQEQTLFWPHKGRLLVVAIVSSDNGDDVVEMMKLVTNSVRWFK
jgi:hypothetical protein